MTAAGRVRAVVRPVVGVVRDFIGHVVVGPVREGRLRIERWPRGLGPVIAIALAGYVLAAVAVVAAGAIREASELTASAGTYALSLPAWTVGPILALVVLALSLAQTAAVRVPLWLGIIVTALSTLVIVSTGVTDTSLDSAVTPGRVAAVVAVAGLWVLFVVRRRRRYAWGEFAAVFVLITIGIGVPAWNMTRAAAAFGIEAGPVTLASLMQNLAPLAYPAALAAGAAVAQLSCAMATQSAASVRRHLPVAVGAALLGALVLWRLWAMVAGFASGEATEAVPFLTATLLVVAVAGSWALVARLRGSSAPPETAALESRFGEISQGIAALLVVGILPTTVLYMLTSILFTVTFDDGIAAPPTALADAIGGRTVTWGLRLAIGLALLVVAARAARQGRTTTPELYASMGVVVVAMSALALAGLERLMWVGFALTVVITVAALALLTAWIVRRRLTPARGAAIGVALLIAALFDQRTFVEDPLKWAFGFAGSAFLLFGFVWALLTGGGRANGTSRRYPRSSRVLLFIANALFGVTVLAFGALARDPDAGVDLNAPLLLGDEMLGTGLLTAALLASLAGAVAPRRTPARPPAETAQGADAGAAASASIRHPDRN
ncbi:hypothetical protein [Microbacterium sp. SS28]|uniref:hypothetical protein n=1 Tax=Microbacterium sp. SS28 TaxID=2919948 RepID=UPI001FAA2A16|nr:hypothetical protein [Microbacterium sp. SS28]